MPPKPPKSNFRLPASRAFAPSHEITSKACLITGVPDLWKAVKEADFIEYIEKSIAWLEEQTVDVNIFGVSVEMTWNDEWTVVFDSPGYESSEWKDDLLTTKDTYFLARVMEKALWFVAQHYPVPVPKPEPLSQGQMEEWVEKALDELQTHTYTPVETPGVKIDKEEWEKMLWGAWEADKPATNYRSAVDQMKLFEKAYTARTAQQDPSTQSVPKAIYAQQAQNYALGLGIAGNNPFDYTTSTDKDSMLDRLLEEYKSISKVKITGV